MGLFSIFKKKENNVPKKEESYTLLANVSNEILEYAKEYIDEDGNFQLSYHRLGMDVFYINNARFHLEIALISCGENVESFYDFKYKRQLDEGKECENFSHVFNAFLVLATNCFRYFRELKSKEDINAFEKGFSESLESLNEAKKIFLDKESIDELINSKNLNNIRNGENIEETEKNQNDLSISENLEYILSKISLANTDILEYLNKIVIAIREKKFNEAYNFIDMLYKNKDIIKTEANNLMLNKINNNLSKMCIDFIKSEADGMNFKISLLKIKVEEINMEYRVGNRVDLSGFKNYLYELEEACCEIRKECEELVGHLVSESLLQVDEEISSEDLKNDSNCDYINKNKYDVRFLVRYYFYDYEEFIDNWENGEFIYSKIENEGYYKIDNYEFKFTRNDKVVVSKSLENSIIELDENTVSVKINGEREYLDLKYKFEVAPVDDLIRIKTVVKELYDSISCMIYVDNNIADEFIKGLNKVKENQLRNKELRGKL